MGYCAWAGMNEAMQRYHDEEWGVPVHEDRLQFEHLMMEVMQCGLNWNMMLQKREVFRSCFAGFDYAQVAAFSEKDMMRILSTAGMIRSRRKVEAVISNARAFLQVRAEFGSFCDYIWGWSEGKMILYDGHGEASVPVSNGLSAEISKDLKKRGFKFLGAVTVYSHLQASGVINDHEATCPCYARLVKQYPTVRKPRDREGKMAN